MKRTEIIESIFNSIGNTIQNVWEDIENPQMPLILNSLLRASKLISGTQESRIFLENWKKIEGIIKSGSNEFEFFRKKDSIELQIDLAREQKVPEEKLCDFYSDIFPWIYRKAEKLHEDFQIFQKANTENYSEALWI